MHRLCSPDVDGLVVDVHTCRGAHLQGALQRGSRLVRAFEEVKGKFDPSSLLNPGKIVHAPKFDDTSLFRYGPDYKPEEMKTELDWSGFSGIGGGPFYGTGYYGGGGLGLIIVVLLILLLLGKI